MDKGRMVVLCTIIILVTFLLSWKFFPIKIFLKVGFNFLLSSQPSQCV